MSSIETRKVNKEVKVQLSVAELAQLGVENGELALERDTIEQEIKDYTKPRKERLKAIEERRDEIAAAEREKEIVRMQEVEMRLDFEAGSVEYWNLEGTEKLEERPMTDSERQVRMFNESVGSAESDESEEEARPEDIEDVMKAEKSRHKADLTAVPNA